MKEEEKYKQITKCGLNVGRRWCASFLVTYPVSYEYNGGIVLKGKWYQGFRVPTPKVPEGFQLRSIGVGLQMNAQPPYATAYLEPLDKGRRVTKAEIKRLLKGQADE